MEARPETPRFHVSRKSDSSSLLPPGKLQEEIFPGTGEIGTEAVHVVRLDDAIGVAELPRPILFKIDVQGLELDVLKGAEASLGGIDHLYVEVSFVPLYTGQAVAHEIVDWLAQRGFRLSGIYHVEFDKAPLGPGRYALSAGAVTRQDRFVFARKRLDIDGAGKPPLHEFASAAPSARRLGASDRSVSKAAATSAASQRVTMPACAEETSWWILTRSEITTGVAQASASITLMPKFSV